MVWVSISLEISPANCAQASCMPGPLLPGEVAEDGPEDDARSRKVVHKNHGVDTSQKATSSKTFSVGLLEDQFPLAGT